jgi:hypothetical protein
MHPTYELADVLRAHWPRLHKIKGINTWQLRCLGALMRCRTADLGGHIDACTACGAMQISYNSCRNRHCPKCQGHKREEWITARERELLPVPYFHVVFTLPSELNQLAIHKPKAVYDSLFAAAWSTLNSFGHDPKHLGAQTGMISILHTWGQQLSLHPHLHCIVPGGGLSKKGHWKPARSKGKFLFPVKAMSLVFKARYLAQLRERCKPTESLLNILYKKDWVVYAKQAFAHPMAVVEYLGRYTHKVAISNHRIQAIDDHNVTFTYKDYRMANQQKTLTLGHGEFIRRFALHILPRGFVRIRHYGILSSCSKLKSLPIIRAQLTQQYSPTPAQPRSLSDFKKGQCPHCKTATMLTVEILPKRGPPSLLAIGLKHFEIHRKTK